MTISRGQMERQLRMGGGIMDVVPREPALLGGIKKAVKKVGKTVKKVASSDVGKAALAAAALYYMPKYGIKAAGGLKPFLVGAPTNLTTGQAAFSGILGTGGQFAPSVGKIATTLGIGGTGKGMGNIGKLTALAGVSAFLTSKYGMTEEQAEEELTRNPSKYLELYYRNLNPPTADTNSEQYEQQVRDFVTANTSEYMAEGGRIGFDEGTPREGILSFEEYFKGKQQFMKEESIEDMIREYKEYLRRMSMKRDMAAIGGKMDTASDNAMQAAAIEGLPLRQNPKGIMELDLREEAGFIPPVGIKEKEDDIPAMLSNNEFVFTADAVRGMGDGDVDLGAQRMYDMMKQLEAGGRV